MTIYSPYGNIYVIRFVESNLDHEIDSLHFTWNGEDPILFSIEYTCLFWETQIDVEPYM
jgi:hypothetical protein